MQEVENAGQRLYAGTMDDVYVLLGARTEQLTDTYWQVEHPLQVLPEGDFSGADVGFKGDLAKSLAITPQDFQGAGVMQLLGVDQSAIEVEEKARQGARGCAQSGAQKWWTSGGMVSRGGCSLALTIVATLMSCSNPVTPSVSTQAGEINADAIEIVLPARYEHWRSGLQAELRQMQEDFPSFAGRWEIRPAEPVSPRRIVVPADGIAAAAFYSEAGLEGYPHTPRTFPGLSLAVVPLPRDDSLIADMAEPPRTWLHSFRHEAAHLMCGDYPALRRAPTWFLEGLAELWCEGAPPQRLTGLQAWPYWRTVASYWGPESMSEHAPAELRYSAFAMRTADALLYSDDEEPWDSEVGRSWSLPTNVEVYQPYLGLRGRDADWSVTERRFMVASRPGQHVDLDLPWRLEPSTTTHLELQQGRAPSNPEAGLIISSAGSDPATSPRLRIRHGQNGGWAAYPENAADVSHQALSPAPQPQRAGMPHQIELRTSEDTLVVIADDLRWSFKFDELNLQPPLQLRMYVRDGVLALRYR